MAGELSGETSALLRRLGLDERVGPVFAREGIDENALPFVSVEDLVGAGVAAEDARKIVSAVAVPDAEPVEAALALSKRFDHKENNGSSPVARVRDAQPRRPLDALGAARDAVEPLWRRAEGDDAVHVEVSFAGALDVYAPREKPSRADGAWRATTTKDSTKVVFFRTNDQLKDMIKRLDTDGLDLSEAVANEIGEIYFENRKVLAPIVLGKKICNKSREAALTKASLHRLIEKVLNYVQYHPKRKGAEPAHGPVMWKLWAVLQKAGVTASGGVEGVLADFGVEGTFHNGYDGGENHVLSKASSVVCKCWMITAARGKLDEKVAQCIGCTFGDGTSTAHEVDGLSTREAGNFYGAAEDLVPLRRAYAEPQLGRASLVDILDEGPLPDDAVLVMGILGDAVVGDAEARGSVDQTVCIINVGGVDFRKVRPTGLCYLSRKPSRWMSEDFGAAITRFKEQQSAVYEIHQFLARHGMRKDLDDFTPTQKLGLGRAITPTFAVCNDLADGSSPLLKTMTPAVVLKKTKKFFGNAATLTSICAWDRGWGITERLEAAIGCKVSELTAAEVSEDDLVKIDGCRPWESRTVPKKRTTENELGKTVLKKRRDEGKKPATCAGCGHKWPSKSTTFNGGFIRCTRCGAFKATYD